MTRVAAIALALVVAGCPKDKPAEVDAAGAPPASVSAAATPVEAAAPAAKETSYQGTYKAEPSPLYIPSENKEYSGVKQAKDDGTKMVGDGTVALSVDGSGRVTGTIDSGPVSPAIIEGVVSDGAVSGSVRRKDAGDDGLSGSFFGKLAGGDGMELVMKLSDANASTLREAKASLKKK